jgi:sporulation protein YlmC with PRC-barrel domain
MKRLSELLNLPVITEDQKPLGRVIDFRCSGEPEHGESRDSRIIHELVYARFGLLERFGLRKAKESTISMDSVRAIKGEKIIVAGSATK